MRKGGGVMRKGYIRYVWRNDLFQKHKKNVQRLRGSLAIFATQRWLLFP